MNSISKTSNPYSYSDSVSTESESDSIVEPQRTSLSDLLNIPKEKWKERHVDFQALIQSLHDECYPKDRDEHLAYLEMQKIPFNSNIAVLGKMDDNSLDNIEEIFLSLQKDKYLDEHFKCTDHHIVFLCPPVTNDRAFELILSFKLENKDQVHLISNDTETNYKNIKNFYTGTTDEDSQESDEDDDSDICHKGLSINYKELEVLQKMLNIQRFYKNLPNGVWLGKGQYMQFSYNPCCFSVAKNEAQNEKVQNALMNLNKILPPDSLSLIDNNTTIGPRFICTKFAIKTISPDLIKSFLLTSLKNIKAVILGEPYQQGHTVQDFFIHKTLHDKTAAITINPSNGKSFNILHMTTNEKGVKNWTTRIKTHFFGTPRKYYIAWQPFKKKDEEIALTSMAALMSLPYAKWSERNTKFLNLKIEEYLKTCVPEDFHESSAALFGKTDLNQNSKIAVIGDIHGDDQRLLISLKRLQTRGFLDENYRCIPGHYILFLGDYIDRGKNNLKVLELLITLKLENKDQVQLLRGNHEDLLSLRQLNAYSANDDRYYNYRMDHQNELLLNKFFNKLPRMHFIGQDDYAMLGHGGVDITIDPAPLLDTDLSHLLVNDSTEFSERIKALINANESGKTDKEKKQIQAAKKLEALSKKLKPSLENILWHDLKIKEQNVNTDPARQLISLDDLKAYLSLSGIKKKAKCLIRGHQHIVRIHYFGKKPIAITLDPSDDKQNQTILIMETKPEFANWQKYELIFPVEAVPSAGSCRKKLIIS